MLRYAGGKSRIRHEIFKSFPWGARGREYREPFLGGGWVALGWLERCGPLYPPARMWVNDRDPFITHLWHVIQTSPDALCAAVRQHVPSVARYAAARRRHATDRPPEPGAITAALDRLILQKQSRGGMGSQAGSPIGGWDQTGEYAINCRWNPEVLCGEIEMAHQALTRQTTLITALDFTACLEGSGAIVYLDPPYVKAGVGLYTYAFAESDHRRLAAALRRCRHDWILSYDNHPLVHELYDGWAQLRPITVRHGGEKKKMGHELVITP